MILIIGPAYSGKSAYAKMLAQQKNRGDGPCVLLTEVQEQVQKLQDYITTHYYRCTDEILASLGQMYVEDEAFRENIDRAGGEGTAEFVSRAIHCYCRR